MPEPKELHKDAVLTNLSILYKNEAMIWPLVMPLIKVVKRSDLYFKYTKEDSFKLVDDKLGPKALPNEVDWGVADDSYAVKDHGLGDWLPQEAIDNADNPLQPEVDTNDFLNRLLDIAQEKRVADIIFAAASYPTGNKTQLSGEARFGGNADDPIGDILTAIEACFMRANTLVFGADVWKVFRKLPEILDAVKSTTRYQGSPGGLATASEVAALFEVDQIVIGRARYNTAKEGQPATYARLWGKHCAALYVEKNPGVKSITFAGTLYESARATTRSFSSRRGISGAHYFKVAWNSDEKVIASDVGYFIEDAVA